MDDASMNSNKLLARSNLLRIFAFASGLGVALTGLCTSASAQPAPAPSAPAPAPAASLPPEKPWTGKPIPYAEVQPILKKYCYDCHGGATPQAKKGGLAIDTLENAIKGGRASKKPTFSPGHVNASEGLRLINLPATDRNHMPQPATKGGPPVSLTADEIQKLTDWVASGASFDLPTSATPTAPAPAAKPTTSNLQPTAQPVTQVDQAPAPMVTSRIELPAGANAAKVQEKLAGMLTSDSLGLTIGSGLMLTSDTQTNQLNVRGTPSQIALVEKQVAQIVATPAAKL
jgi:hypothetical protein